MKRATYRFGTACVAAALIASGSAWAADARSGVAEESQNNVSYMSGGVGDDEAIEIKNRAAGYPLELNFVQKAVPRDEFLADVRVRITDRAKNAVVVDAVSNGPYFLAKLPSGRYDVEADYNGVVKRRALDLR